LPAQLKSDEFLIRHDRLEGWSVMTKPVFELANDSFDGTVPGIYFF